MPDGVSVDGEKLVFGRPVQLNDSGTYECTVKNAVGSGKTEFTLVISGKIWESLRIAPHKKTTKLDSFLLP